VKLVIETQYNENYGAHNWNGEGECPQYWKSKGGSTYVVENFVPDFDDLSNQVAKLIVLAKIEHRDEASEEYVIDWTVEDDSYETHNEKRDNELEVEDEYYAKDVRWWDYRLNQETGDRSQKFRGYDGKIYLRTWPVNGEFSEKEIA
jgi:hypothetical protein